ncbi:MAG TPA: hypothetical protein VHS96_02750, partial [Bacteroidia bacterium]|nr:hypothetical protein [Bacteroidia bacterium]
MKLIYAPCPAGFDIQTIRPLRTKGHFRQLLGKLQAFGRVYGILGNRIQGWDGQKSWIVGDSSMRISRNCSHGLVKPVFTNALPTRRDWGNPSESGRNWLEINT